MVRNKQRTAPRNLLIGHLYNFSRIYYPVPPTLQKGHIIVLYAFPNQDSSSWCLLPLFVTFCPSFLFIFFKIQVRRPTRWHRWWWQEVLVFQPNTHILEESISVPSSQKSQGNYTWDPGLLTRRFLIMHQTHRKCRLSFHLLGLENRQVQQNLPESKTTGITKTKYLIP